MIKFKLQGNKFFINDEYVIIRDHNMREALDIFCRLNNHPNADQYYSGMGDDEFHQRWTFYTTEVKDPNLDKMIVSVSIEGSRHDERYIYYEKTDIRVHVSINLDVKGEERLRNYRKYEKQFADTEAPSKIKKFHRYDFSVWVNIK